MAVEKIELASLVEDSDPRTRDCLSDCYDSYTSCWANAGSDLEKGVCNDKLRRCIEGCS